MSSPGLTDKEKEDEFVDYLEQSGIIDRLSDVFMMLYNENPLDPIDFVRSHMNPDNEDVRGIANVLSMIADAEVELERLQNFRNELESQLGRLGFEGCSSDEGGSGVEADDFGRDQEIAPATNPAEPE